MRLPQPTNERPIGWAGREFGEQKLNTVPDEAHPVFKEFVAANPDAEYGIWFHRDDDGNNEETAGLYVWLSDKRQLTLFFWNVVRQADNVDNHTSMIDQFAKEIFVAKSK